MNFVLLLHVYTTFLKSFLKKEYIKKNRMYHHFCTLHLSLILMQYNSVIYLITEY